jgi:gamma-glutamyltranspeptidase/glutathione hydrolase
MFAGKKPPSNTYGWLAVGVPGILAGLQRLVERHGNRSFGDALLPSVKLARDGFELTAMKAAAIRGSAVRLKADPGAAKLLLPGGEPPKAGSVFKNPDLAAMLQGFAETNSAGAFYRGEVARKFAAEAKKHGGLVTEEDLAAYQPREVEAVAFTWGKHTLFTAPPSAGGATVLQALAVAKALGWDTWPAQDAKAYHARLELLRAAWDDRLKYFGDPKFVDVPLTRLLSAEHATKTAERVKAAVRDGKPIEAKTDGRPAGGTTHISAADAAGNLAAITVTHGGAFGANVAVDGLGLVLGHGMSRFDPQPGRPNSIAPGKFPLNNMCPIVVLRDGQPRLALGGRGGRRIPNTLFEVLLQYVAGGANLEMAIAAPRLHTEAGMNLGLEAKYPADAEALFRKLGYTIGGPGGAMASAVEFDAATGTLKSAVR